MSNVPLSTLPQLPAAPADRPTLTDRRVSLAAMLSALTTCCAVLATIKLTPESFWLSVGHAAVLLLGLLAFAAMVFLCSLAFMLIVVGGAVLATKAMVWTIQRLVGNATRTT